MLSSPTIVFVILLGCCHRKFFYAMLMAMEQIPYMYKIDDTHICTTPEQHIFTLPSLPPDSKGEGLAKALLVISTLIAVIFTALGIFINIWKRHRFK